MTTPMGPTPIAPLADCLQDLAKAAAGHAKIWQPNSPEYRTDVYRQIMMQLSCGQSALFHADAEHPDWAPLSNPFYAMQTNPDDICLQSPISPTYSYRISGHRGTVRMITFHTQCHHAGYPGPIDKTGEHYADLDDRHLHIAPDGKFDILLSAERPAGFKGNWLQIKPEANVLIVRKRSYDWVGEIDPVLSIECLDPVPPKARWTPDEMVERIGHTAAMQARATELSCAMHDQVREAAGVNVFRPASITGALSRQVYLPAVYAYAPDEALILTTELPRVRPYWNFQINDPYGDAVEHVYRLSSTNGHFARVSSDGKFRAVLSLEDPGVPNWLDTAGFTEGTISGCWYDCDSCPTPTLKRVKFADLRSHLPADTRVVTPEQRADELRSRVRGWQRRRRW